MTVTVYPQFNFYATTLFDDSNVENSLNNYFICINSSGHIYSVPHFKQRHPNVLNMYFDDTDRDKLKVSGNIVYYARVCTREQAKEIKCFVDTIPQDAEVHVYCAKGKSRSTAVGKFVEDYLNLPFKTEYKSYNQFLYNLLCSI
jgi:predicted protein tyrosine phosphatase